MCIILTTILVVSWRHIYQIFQNIEEKMLTLIHKYPTVHTLWNFLDKYPAVHTFWKKWDKYPTVHQVNNSCGCFYDSLWQRAFHCTSIASSQKFKKIKHHWLSFLKPVSALMKSVETRSAVAGLVGGTDRVSTLLLVTVRGLKARSGRKF